MNLHNMTESSFAGWISILATREQISLHFTELIGHKKTHKFWNEYWGNTDKT